MVCAVIHIILFSINGECIKAKNRTLSNTVMFLLNINFSFLP